MEDRPELINSELVVIASIETFYPDLEVRTGNPVTAFLVKFTRKLPA
jgi:hypothetical protein